MGSLQNGIVDDESQANHASVATPFYDARAELA
jgi:hypothetical protein